MTVGIELTNKRAVLTGLPTEAVKEIDKATSYAVAGAEHSSAHKNHRWDGRRHMLRVRRSGGHTLPTGLVDEAIRVLDRRRINITVDDKRRRPGVTVPYPWRAEIEPRDYQAAAYEALRSQPRLVRTRGIFRMATRSGKTITAAWMISQVRVPTLFVVTSQFLMWQTKQALERVLDTEVGVIGDSVCDVRPLTVAMVHTLAKRREQKDPLWKEVRTKFGMAIFDETHHLEADDWRKVFDDIDAFWKVGLSATVWLDEDGQVDAQTVLLKSSAGPIVHDVPLARLMDEGWLVPCTVELHKVRSPDYRDRGWSSGMVSKAMTRNPARNNAIARRVREFADEGRRTIVVANRLHHVEDLVGLLAEHGVKAAPMVGDDSKEARRAKVDHLEQGKLDAIVSTVLGEGADIPCCSAVVNAEGGKSRARALQRMRCLTPAGGGKAAPDEDAVFVDFVDLTNPYLADHSGARIQAYKAERAFKFTKREVDSGS